jgi:integrase
MAKTRAGTEFTARWLDRVPLPASGREEHWDAIVHGLGLRVSATGHKSWFVIFRPDPKKSAVRVTLGSYPAMSLLEARDAARARIELDRARASDDHAGLTVEQMVREYLETCAKPQLRPSSLKRISQILRTDVVPAMGDRLAADIKRRDVIAWAERIKERGAPVQANRAIAVLRRVYNWAISKDMIEVNPCAQVKKPAQESYRDRVLTEGELRAVWRYLDQEEPTIAALFRLQILTGQRGGEVRSMRWEDVDLRTSVWTIPAAQSKNRLAHRVPLTAPAMAILEGLGASPDSKGPVIPGGKPHKRPELAGEVPLFNPYKAVERVRQGSGVDFVPHDLRRTVASYMAQLEISEETIGKVLNHAPATITSQRYIRHGYDKQKREALDLWAERLMAVVD